MNKKGTALIETMIILPVFVLLLCQMHWIGRGWITRIKNRMICRYTATYAARNNHLPLQSDIQQKFNLNADEIKKLHIESHQSTRWRFRKFWIRHRYMLWKGTRNEGLLKKIF